jgi:hypothetical protein
VRRTKDILRLRFDSGLGLREIARSLSVGVATVHDYLQRAWVVAGFGGPHLRAVGNKLRSGCYTVWAWELASRMRPAPQSC